jgi:glycosyltransferase involved in cell wall biosynthesis
MLSVGYRAPSTPVREARPKIRIGLVTDQPFPGDSRVERQAVALVEAGYEVHVLCLLRPQDKLMDEAYRGVYVHRVDPHAVNIQIPWLGRTSRFLYQGLVRGLFKKFRNIDTAWHTLIHRFARNCRLHVLHIHGYGLLDTALNVSSRYGIPLVADLPGHAPALVELSYPANRERQAAAQRQKVEARETESILRASRILTATPEARQRILRKGINPDLVITLENTVEIDSILGTPLDQEVIKRFKSNFVLTYVGRIGETWQGIHTVLETMAVLKEHIPEIMFIGAGPIRESYRRQLQPFIEEHGLENHVYFAGRLSELETVSYIAVSDICIFPHLVNDHTEITFPDAAYRCQVLKKPVVLGSTAPMERYAEESGGALNFPSGNASVLAEMLYTLFCRPDLRRDMSLNGHRTIMERYHWAHTASDLVVMYDQLTGQFASSSSPSSNRPISLD